MRMNLLSVAVVSLSTAAFGLLVTPTVSADEIWYQSVGRSGATATCQDSSASDMAAGWTVWRPTWEQWMNRGTGGFTCSRAITWAKSSTEAGAGGGGGGAAGCQIITTATPHRWVIFGASNFLAIGSTKYSDSSCSTANGTTSPTNLVYAASNAAAAVICRTQLNDPSYGANGIGVPANIFNCAN